MIIDRVANGFAETLPFSVSFDEETMVAKVSSGRIYLCYNNCGNEPGQSFSNGCRYMDVESKDVDVEYGDWIFLSAKSTVEHLEWWQPFFIFKQSKLEREQGVPITSENPILIWKAPSEAGGDGIQFLSENIFIQDPEANREFGFQIKRTGYSETKDYYKINSGFVACPALDFIEYVPGITFDQPKEEARKMYRLKISVTATVSSAGSLTDENHRLINGAEITSVVLEESPEEGAEDPIALKYEGDNLTGTYFIEEGGFAPIVCLTPELETKDEVYIEPFLQSEVRGAEYYKNGVLVNSEEVEPGYYQKVIVTKTYQKYTESEDGTVSGSGTYEIVTTYTPTNPGLLVSETEPVIQTQVEESGLEDDEFITFPPLSEVTETEGGEISGGAFAACKAACLDLEFEPHDTWSGSPVPVTEGAGKRGETDKTFYKVHYAERRYKRAGVPSGPVERNNFFPESFQHFTAENYYGDPVPVLKIDSIPFSDEKGYYLDSSWQTVEVRDDESTHGMETLMSDCEAQDKGGFSSQDVTRAAYYIYQSLSIT